MTSGIKVGLVVSFIGLIGLTLFLVSQSTGDKTKDDLPFDATAQKSRLAEDLTDSMRKDPPKAAPTRAPNTNRTATRPPRTDKPLVDRGTPGRNNRPGVTPPTGTNQPRAGTKPNRPGTNPRTNPPAGNGSTTTRRTPTAPRAAIAEPTPQPKPKQPTAQPGRTTTGPNGATGTKPPIQTGRQQPKNPNPTRPPAGTTTPPKEEARPAAPAAVPARPARRDEPLTPRGSKPEQNPTPKPTARAAGDQEHIVESGDNLSVIAGQYYEDDKLYKAIILANPELKANPDKLKIGQKLLIPSEARAKSMVAQARSKQRAVPAPKPSTHSTYTVAPGDSLIKIARDVLKDENRWKEIFELNKDKLKGPDQIQVGMELKLPK